MSSSYRSVEEPHHLDEGSWVYLSLRSQLRGIAGDLQRQVVDACESSGWPTVSWSPAISGGDEADSSRFFEAMDHAVEHADVVVALISGSSTITDAELAFAYKHKRPVVGLQFGWDEHEESDVQTMLHGYARGRLVECADVEDCAASLRRVFSDPEFASVIRQAAGELEGHV